MPFRRSLLLALMVAGLTPSLAHAAGVQPGFDLSSPSGSPFPSDRYTDPDATQLTGLRVALPKPNCAVFPSDCLDVDVLNELDGFNVQPRISIPFTGAIDPASATSDSIFLVKLSDDEVTGINQVIWNPASATLHAESRSVARPVHDVSARRHNRRARRERRSDRAGEVHPRPELRPEQGSRRQGLPEGARQGLEPLAPRRRPQGGRRRGEPLHDPERDPATRAGPAPDQGVHPGARELHARHSRRADGVPSDRRHLDPVRASDHDCSAACSRNPASGPRRARPLRLGRAPSPSARTTRPTTRRRGSGFRRPARRPACRPSRGRTECTSTSSSRTARRRRAAGRWRSSATASATTRARARSSSPRRWPRRGSRRSRSTSSVTAAARSARSPSPGRLAPPVTLLGRRPRDRPERQRRDRLDRGRERRAAEDARRQPRRPPSDGDRPDAARPRDRGRDGRRRQRQPRPRPGSRISYFGQSFGGIYGTKFLAVEPNVRAGVPNVPGGAMIEIARLSQSFRPLVWLSLVGRTPPLVNLPGLFQFNENIPLRNLPPVIDTVPGAAEIQRLVEWTEWASQSGNPVAYAPHLILEPLAGVPAKSVILQFARGDKTVPNPTTSAIIRAGGLESRTTLFRNDLARAAIPALPSNPHTFLTGSRRSGHRRSRSRRRPRSRRSSQAAAPSRSTPTARGRSSRRRWWGRRRRIWPTCRRGAKGAGVATTPAPSCLVGSRHAGGAAAARRARPWS